MRKTSLESYRAIKENGILSQRRFAAYDALFRLGPLTGQELAKATKIPGMWKRCSELQAAGVVEEVGERQCGVTGENAILWDVTAYVPSSSEAAKTPKRVSLAKRVEQLEMALADLRRHASKPQIRTARSCAHFDEGQLPLFP